MRTEVLETVGVRVTLHDNDVAVIAVDDDHLPDAPSIVEREKPGLFVIVVEPEVQLESTSAGDGGDSPQKTSLSGGKRRI